jgi:hypothetical protein
LLQGPLKHVKGAALAAALLSLASLAAAPASQQTLCPSAGICGFVYNDTSGDGTLDAGEPGIADVHVTVCQLCDGSDDRDGITGGDGFFYFPLPGGHLRSGSRYHQARNHRR